MHFLRVERPAIIKKKILNGRIYLCNFETTMLLEYFSFSPIGNSQRRMLTYVGLIGPTPKLG